MTYNKVLVVDDEKPIINLLVKVFSRAGYTVKSAFSGQDALEILKEDKIHIIFLDLNMPGMNGIELCKAIRKDLPMAMIFAVTGYASVFELSDCRECGFDDYFKKPVSLPLLLKTAADASSKISRWKKN